MKRNLQNNVSGANRASGRLAINKKKAVFALCLIAVMVFMWVRVLTRKSPQSAAASSVAEEIKLIGQSDTESLKLSFIELPKVKGRNDVLARDFFTVKNWQDFLREGKGVGDRREVDVVSRNGNEEVARKIAEKLKLGAIVMGKNPRAFVNDKLLAVGDKMLIQDGVNIYECEIVEIEEKTVLLRCGQAEIRLKLRETNSNANWMM
ncbi:MAG: hypothetical protein V3W45_06985 [Sedimentisphaerales bacterium]